MYTNTETTKSIKIKSNQKGRKLWLQQEKGKEFPITVDQEEEN